MVASGESVCELRHHRRSDRHAARQRTRPPRAALPTPRRDRQDRDEDQQRNCRQTKEAQAERHPLPDRGGDFGGAHMAHAARQRAPQHAPAVHGKGRDGVEQHQESRSRSPAGRACPTAELSTAARFFGFERGAEDEGRETAANYHVHRRPGDGRTKNSSTAFPECPALEPRPPIGNSVTVGVVTPNRRGHEDMAELVAPRRRRNNSSMKASEYQAACAPPEL